MPSDGRGRGAAVSFYRAESTTQTTEDARRQQETGELWGKTPPWSHFPQVKAFVGELPEDQRGIQFTTDVPPDSHCPPGKAFWSGPRQGVVVQDGCAKIKITVTKNTQTT